MMINETESYIEFMDRKGDEMKEIILTSNKANVESILHKTFLAGFEAGKKAGLQQATANLSELIRK